MIFLEMEWFFFIRMSLCNLGLTIYLGHQGKPCPYVGHVGVIHTNSIHNVKVLLCSCHDYHLQAKFQLLWCSWLPATMEDLQTAFTFDVLNSYVLLSLQGKVSQEDYYVFISCHTNNVGLDPPKVINLIASIYPMSLTSQRSDIQNFFMLSRYGNISCF